MSAASQCSVAPAVRTSTRGESLISLMDKALQDVRVIRNRLTEMEGVLLGAHPAPEKGKIPQEIFTDTISGNQDRILSDIFAELAVIEEVTAHLREYA